MGERIDIVVSERGSRRVSRNIDRIGTSAAASGGAVKLLRRALGLLGGALILGTTIRTLANFSQEMATVKAISRATGAEFEQLRDTAKELGATTRFSATQAAEGMTFLARAGFDANEVMQAIPATLNLATAGALDLAAAADIASNVLKGFNLETDQTNRVVDVLALTANSANTTVQQLGDAMSFVAPAAASLGINVETAAASIGVLSDAGIQATRAGTGLRQIFVKMVKPTGEAKKAIEGLGLGLKDVDIGSRGLIPVLETLRTKNLTLAQAVSLVGVRQASGLLILLRSIPRLKELTKQNVNAAGAVDEFAKIMDDNLNGALIRVKSATEAVIIAFGDLGAESTLKGLFEDIADGLRFMAANMNQVIEVVRALGLGFAAVFAARLATRILSISKAVALLNAVLRKSPLFLLVTIIGGIVAAFSLLRKEFVTVNGQVTTLGDLVSATFGNLFKFIKNTATILLNVFVPGLTSADLEANKLAQTLTDSFVPFLKFLAQVISRVTQLGTVFALLAKSVKIAFKLVIQDILDGIEGLINGISRGIKFVSRGRVDLGEVKLVTDKFREDLAQQEIKLFADLAKAVAPKFREDIEKGILLGIDDVADTAIDRARLKLLAGDFLQQLPFVPEPEAGGAPAPSAGRAAPAPDAAVGKLKEFLKDLRTEGELLRLNNGERAIREALMAAEDKIGQPLLETQKAQVTALVEQNAALAEQRTVLDEIQGPQEAYETRLAAINALLDDNKIKQADANQKIRENRIVFLDQQRDFASGVERGFLRALDASTNFARQSEQAISEAFTGAGDVLKNFFETGKLDAESLIRTLITLAAKLLAIKALEAATGGGGLGSLIGGGGGIGGLFSGLFGAANGASFTVGQSSAAANLASGVDNRLLILKARDGERVTVEPPGREQARSGGVTLVQNINTPDANSFRRSTNQQINRAGAALGRAQARR